MTKEVFVFVVCGSKEHIDTLHFSLAYLQRFSQKSNVILTDSSRNEIKIEHTDVIDVNTPEHFNHHQASIYLKTGIHKFLPKGNRYCYLDTDVVALNESCDEIFNEYQAPITFAPDHCKVRSFSAYAVNCGCYDRCLKDRELFYESYKRHNQPLKLANQFLKSEQRRIEKLYQQLQSSFIRKVIYAFRYYLSFPKFWIDSSLYYDKKKKYWATKDGEIVKYGLNVKSIAREANLKYTLWFNKWKNKKGENIFEFDCEHLTAFIKDTFDIDVLEKNWQHWNGGVFLFDDNSHDFLDAWHNKTMHIFNLENWKTRDQGTLIATAWEFGLEHHKTLSKEWNFIADFHNNSLVLNYESGVVSDDLFVTNYHPKFIHVFHEWGNDQWEIWNWILTKSTE